jgi:leader peptidase (prepilin peptidase)/N-methyltransferase
MIPVLFAALVAGWLVGAAANWAADTLPAWGKSQPQAGASPGVVTVLHYWTSPWYPFRRGICPHCGERRPWRAPVLEAVMMVAFVVTVWLAHGALVATAIGWLYAAFLLTVLVIDFEHRRVLNVMVVPAAVVVLLLSLLPAPPTLSSALLGGAAGFGSFLLLALIGRGALGMGDVKLAGVIGLMTGFPGVLYALAVGILLGGLAAVLLLATKRATRKSYMAYAPYLALGALATIWGMLW